MLSARMGADLPTVSRIRTLERILLAPGSDPLGGDYRSDVGPWLIDIGYLSEGIEGVAQPGLRPQLECVEAAAFHEREVVSGNVTERADFAAVTVALAKPARLGITPSVGETAELQRNQGDGCQIVEDVIEAIAGGETYPYRARATTQLGPVKPPIREGDDDGAGSGGA